MPLATNNTPAAVASQAGPDGGIFQAFKPGTTQNVGYTGTAGTISNAVGTSLARVYCTTDAFVAVGETATSASMPVAAGVPEYVACDPNDTISAIQQTGGGTLYVTAAATAL